MLLSTGCSSSGIYVASGLLDEVAYRRAELISGVPWQLDMTSR